MKEAVPKARRPKKPDPALLRVGLVQMPCARDPAVNLRHAVEGIEDAVRGGAKVVCLQELFRSIYFCHREDHAYFDLAEPVPGPTTAALGALARRRKVVIIAPVFERRARGVYHNSAAVIDADGKVAGLYRKMHIPDDPGYYEKFYFAPGDLGFRAFDTAAGRIAVLICWDQWFPEAARAAALAGADVIFYPTAIGWSPLDTPQDHRNHAEAWELIQRSHAIANGVFVAAVNRVGTENGINFWGGSFLADPGGVVLARAGRDRAEVLLADCDLGQIDRHRQHWPYLRDRRVDAYGDLLRRYAD